MHPDQRPLPRERFLAVTLLLIVGCFTLRLAQLQIMQHERWAGVAERQTHDLCEVKPSRGEIRDRHDLPLAVTLPLTYAVGFRPAPGLDLEAMADSISQFLPISRETVRRKLDASQFVYLARRVDMNSKRQLEALEYSRLQFDCEPRRSYPAASMLASIIGFANVDGVGMEGIERSFDEALAGKQTRQLRWSDARRGSSAILNTAEIEERRGANVRLTIDLQLQTIVERAMRSGLADLKYERSCALLMDPWTGEILALSTLPSYDPNRPGDCDSRHRRCWPVTDVYEPGSTLKVIPIALGLQSGVISRHSEFDCEMGAYRVRGATIHDTHPHGRLCVDSILAYSSNIGAAKIAEQLEPDLFYDRLRAFGFGNRTGIEIAAEQSGVVPKPRDWSGPTCSNLAMGQGLSCTPLQLSLAFSAIANGGNLVKPHLVKSVEYPDGTREEIRPEIIRRAISERVAEQLTSMLIGVVETGTGKSAAIPGLTIAGKTGTAQKVDLENHTYFSKRFVSSFVGYFPAHQPRYVLLVVVDDPVEKYYGASVAAPIFREIASELMVVRPDDFPTNPREMAMLAADVWPDETPPALPFGDCLEPEFETDTDQPLVEMPFIEGMPIRRAAHELALLGLDFHLSGSGVVASQYPRAGYLIPVGFNCQVNATN